MDIKRNIQNVLMGTGNGVKIAVLDSGINLNYPLLRNRKGHLYDCILNDDVFCVKLLENIENYDRNGHGSGIESCILTVAPDVEIDHFRILDEHNACSGILLCYVLDYLLEKDYKIINLSLGTRNENHIPWLVSILKRAYEAEIAIVAANSNVGNYLYPAHFTYTISCKAMYAAHPLFIQFNEKSIIEFSAFGINVPINITNNQSIQVSGSSYATAHITGLVARFIEIAKTSNVLDLKIMLREYAKNLISKDSSEIKFA